MKPTLLISAYSFGPRSGSETGIGWATATGLARHYRVIVVCAAHYRDLFTQSDLESLHELGVEVSFFDVDHLVWMLRIPPRSLAVRIYYCLWQRAARARYRELIARHTPVALVHSTWSLGRVTSGLTGLGVPVVFGPVGGFETAGATELRGLPWRLRAAEWIRNRSIRASLRSKRLRRMYAALDLVIACTPESRAAVTTLGARRVACLSNAGVPSRPPSADATPPFTPGQPLEVLFAGRLLGWKGEELAIRAMARVTTTDWRLTILGSGPNLDRCQRVADSCGVADRVRFVSAVAQTEVGRFYQASHLLLFPSLHDSGGIVVLEAMQAGLPVVCLDLGGPGLFIDAGCGIKIAPAPVARMVEQLAEAVASLARDPERMTRLGRNGRLRCEREFTWEARNAALAGHIAETLRHARPVTSTKPGPP